MKLFEKVMHALSRRLSELKISRRAHLNGKTFILPYMNGVNCDLSEPWMLELLKNLLDRSEGVFLDVGINTGQTLVKVKAIDPDRQYVGLEPNPVCVSYVQSLIQKNSIMYCDIIPAALLDQSGILELSSFSADNADSSASVISGFRPGALILAKSTVVAIGPRELTQYLSRKTVSVVKIDVEGAELECLMALEQIIQHHKPILIVEILPVYSEDNRIRLERQQAIEALLSSMSYVMYRVAKYRDNSFTKLIKIETIGIHSNLQACDYVFAPSGMDLP